MIRNRTVTAFCTLTLLFLVNPQVFSQVAVSTGSKSLQVQNLQNALTTLSQDTSINVRLTGIKTIGNRQTNYIYDSYFQTLPSTNGGESVKLAIFAYENGQIVKEWVADGTNLWQYSFRKNEYVVKNYTTALNQPAVDVLFQYLSSLTDEFSNPIVTLLRQAYTSTGPVFHSWLGGGQLQPANPQYPDTVTYSTSTQYYNFNWMVNPNTSSTAFQSVDYSSLENNGGYTIQTQWQLVPTPAIINQLDFKFVPPVGAIPISVGQ